MAQVQTQFKPILVKIPVNVEPVYKALAVEKAIYQLALGAKYEFVWRKTRVSPVKHYELGMVKWHDGYKGLNVTTYNDKVVVEAGNEKISIDVNDPEDIYLKLWRVAELLGYKEFTTINDDPESEGVELHEYGKTIQIWANDNCNEHYRSCEPYEILVMEVEE